MPAMPGPRRSNGSTACWIDTRLKAFDWSDLSDLLKLAQVPRVSRLVQLARATVRRAQQEWPPLLDAAPDSMRRVVTERLNGGVALTRG